MSGRVALIGVPWDAHSSHARGPARAPAAIRAALACAAGNAFASNGTDIRHVLDDRGDLDLTDEPSAFDRIAAAAAQGPFIALGGDHAVTFPLFQGLVGERRDVAIVHFDAHPDLYDDFEGDPLSHASPFARIMERGLAASLVQIGIRASNPDQRAQAARFGVKTFGPDEVDEALAALPRGPVYVSIDLDGLDPAFAPAVNHHEPGGLTTREVLKVIAALQGPILAADIVELVPDKDATGMTAALAAKLVKELAAAMA